LGGAGVGLDVVAKRKISISVDKEMVNSVAVVSSAGETGGACTNYRGPAVRPEGGLGPECVA